MYDTTLSFGVLYEILSLCQFAPKSILTEVQLALLTTLYFPQYQISLWFYLRNTITQMSPDDFETTFPSSSAAALVRDEVRDDMEEA